VIPAVSGAIGPLGPPEWTMGPLAPADPTAAAATTAPTGPAPAAGATATQPTSFGGALTQAINALEQSQVNGSNAAQALATGQAPDPTQAVTAVENAALDMQFASQVRTKLDEAATTIFQTQV
jgi:flagellar hook-basal body complex protein FliE